jgi:hypothetical protein
MDISANIIKLAIENAKLIKLNESSKELTSHNINIKTFSNKVFFDYKENIQHPGRVSIIKNIFNQAKLPDNFECNVLIADYNKFEGGIGFCRLKNQNIALIPDAYQITGIKMYEGDLELFTKKKNKAIFAGGASGGQYFKNNKRLNNAKYVYDNKLSLIDYYITKTLESNDPVFNDFLMNYKSIFTPKKTITEQLEYKYIYSVDGNAAAWDRPVWVMSSNSLLIKDTTRYELWYDSLFKKDEHYIESTIYNIENTITFLNNNPNICMNIIKEANINVKNYCSKEAAEVYLNAFFEECYFLYN